MAKHIHIHVHDAPAKMSFEEAKKIVGGENAQLRLRGFYQHPPATPEQQKFFEACVVVAREQGVTRFGNKKS